jgi:hypothetical protein
LFKPKQGTLLRWNYDKTPNPPCGYHQKYLWAGRFGSGNVKKESGVMLSLSLSRLGPVPSKLFCSVRILKRKFPLGPGPAAQIARI